MRVIKDPEERKSEILDAAEMLFTSKGYAKTTINDILNEVGIAKGTFYYYFKSKEEVMDAIIMRAINAEVAAAKEIAANPGIPALHKLFQILMMQRTEKGGSKEKMIEQFHQPNNAEMHQKSKVQSILHFTPILTEVVEQGVEENVFATDYPQEITEFLLVSSFIFDEGLFDWQPAELLRKAEAFVYVMEIVLGAEKGSFDFMYEMIANQV